MASMPKNMAKTNIQKRFLSLLDSLSAVRRFSEINLATISEEELLEGALRALVDHHDMAFCSLFLPDEEGVLRCAVGMGVGEQLEIFREDPVFSEMAFTAGEGIMGIAYQTGMIQYCHNCSRDERFIPFPSKSLFRGHGSIVSVPVNSAGEVLAVLNVSHHHPDYFESWQQHMLILFGNILGHTLSSHRLIHALDLEVQRRTEKLEEALAESERQRQRCQDLSYVDELTGLHNQRYFRQEGSSLLARSIRLQQPMSLLLIEVDRLHGVRETGDQDLDDRLLQSLAGELGYQVRACDVVARIDAEEFAVILSDTSAGGAELFAQRIQEGARDLQGRETGGKLGFTVSIGMAGLNEPLENVSPDSVLERLYQEARQALQYCQSCGGDRRRLFKDQLADGSDCV